MVDWDKLAKIATVGLFIVNLVYIGLVYIQINKQQELIITEIQEIKTKIIEINKLRNVSSIEAPPCPEGYRSMAILTGNSLRFECVPVNTTNTTRD